MNVYIYKSPIPEDWLLGYRPLQSDLLDASGNNKNWSWYSGTGSFWAVAWKTGARVTRNTSNYNSTQHIITPIVHDKKDITIACRINFDSNSMVNGTWTWMASNTNFENHESVSYTFSQFWLRGPDSYKVYAAMWWDNTLLTWTPTAWTWYCYILTSDWINLKLYVNWSLIYTKNNYNWADTNWWYAWRFWKWAGLVWTNWYIRHCALYNRALTANEALEFYNWTI